MSRRAPEISVVIPVHDEEDIVLAACEDLLAGMRARSLDFELLVVENGSRDATWSILEEAATRVPELRPLQLPRPDYGEALRAGIREARGALVICEEIDLGDLDFHDQALGRLRAGNADLVVGSKAAPGARDRRPLMRRAGTRVLGGLLRVAVGFEGTDTHGLKAFRRDSVLPVVDACTLSADLFASELVIRAERAGLAVVEIPVDVRERRPPSTGLMRRVPRVLRDLLRLRRTLGRS